MEAIRGEVVGAQVLAIVVRADIVDVHLVALLDLVEEEMRVGHVEDHLLHAEGDGHQGAVVFGVSVGIAARQQRVEDDERLVQIPDEHPLRWLHRLTVPGVRGSASGGAGLLMASTTRPTRLTRGRGLARCHAPRAGGTHTAASARVESSGRSCRGHIAQRSNAGASARRDRERGVRRVGGLVDRRRRVGVRGTFGEIRGGRHMEAMSMTRTRAGRADRIR